MSRVMIQVRNVPAELHRRLKVRAAVEGISMSDFVMREVRKALDRPTRAEILERLRSRPAVRLRRAPAEIIRAERDSR
jgi:plasmid stability protein